MKLCKDCKYYKFDWMSPFSGQYAKCLKEMTSETKTEVNYVTGKVTVIPIGKIGYCSVNRKYDHCCGNDATWFEAKK